MPRIFCCISPPVVIDNDTNVQDAVAANETTAPIARAPVRSNHRAQLPIARISGAPTPAEQTLPETATRRIPPRLLSALARDNESAQIISSAKFDTMNVAAKIKWLRRSAPPLAEGEDPGTNIIEVGPRKMTRRNVLCMALDFAIKGKKDQVPAICAQLVKEYQAQDMNFLVLGIPFSRDRLSEWARQNLSIQVPEKIPSEIKDMERQMYVDSSQNVHAPSVTIALASQLITIKNRIPAGNTLTCSAAEVEIKAYLNQRQHATAALNGLTTVSGRPEKVTNFDESVRSSLTILWNYINSVENTRMQQDLRESMAAKLSEIGQERPCAVGMIERIIDIPTAIDWSMTQKVSVEQLRNELQTMAGVINEHCDADDDIRIQAEIAIAEATGPNSEEEVNDRFAVETTKLKRDRFFHTARIELGLLRGINQQMIATEADRIFPKDMIL